MTLSLPFPVFVEKSIIAVKEKHEDHRLQDIHLQQMLRNYFQEVAKENERNREWLISYRSYNKLTDVNSALVTTADTGLHLLAKYGYNKSCALLISDYGANPFKKDRWGMTVFYMAAQNGLLPIIEVCIAQMPKNDSRPLYLAWNNLNKSASSPARCLRAFQSLHLLMENGLNLNSAYDCSKLRKSIQAVSFSEKNKETFSEECKNIEELQAALLKKLEIIFPIETDIQLESASRRMRFHFR